MSRTLVHKVGRGLVQALALSVLAVAGPALTAEAAFASCTPRGCIPSPPHNDSKQCKSNWLCFWGDQNYSGRHVYYANVPKANIHPSMNDLTTSIWNRTSRTYCFYENADQNTLLLCLGPGKSSWNVGSANNDRISSFAVA